MNALRWLAFLLCWGCQQRPAVTDPCDRETAKIVAGCAAEIELCQLGGEECKTEECRVCVRKAADACDKRVDETVCK